MSAAEQLDYAQTTQYVATPTWIVKAVGVKAGSKLCWQVLKSFDFRRKNVVWPSRKTVAEAMGVSDRAVTDYLAELSAAGMIVRRRRYLHHDRSGNWSFAQDDEFTTRTTDEITLAWDGPLNVHLEVVPPIAAPLPYIAEAEDNDLDAADSPVATEGAWKESSRGAWKESSSEVHQVLSNETPKPPLMVSVTSVDSIQGNSVPPEPPCEKTQQLQTKRARGENPRALGTSPRQSDEPVVREAERKLAAIVEREHIAATVAGLQRMRPHYDSDHDYREYLDCERSQGRISDQAYEAALSKIEVNA
jgi:DNA-binding transcriptional MocR family regulator